MGEFKNVPADVLLLGGSKSNSYFKISLDALESVLPRATRVDFRGFDHLPLDNKGRSEILAKELIRFFQNQKSPERP